MKQTLLQQLSEAEYSFRTGDVPRAGTLLSQILREDARNPKANALMGYIAGGRGDYATATRCLTLAANAKGAGPETWYYLGVALQKAGNQKEAILAFRRALKLAGDFFEGLHDLGVSLSLAGNPAEAIVQFDKALAIHPTASVALMNKGLALARLERKEEEYDCYRKALAIDPAQRDLLLNIGSVAADLGKAVESESWFAQAIRHYPSAPEVYNLYGAALFKCGRYTEALAQYDKALALNDAYAEAWFNRAIVFNSMMRYDEALANYDEALAIRPDYAQAWVNRGTVFNNLKCYADALACYDQALAVQPNHPEAWSSKAVTLNNAKRFEEAVQAFTTLLDIAPDYPFAKGRLLYAKLLCCDWKGLAQLASAIKADLRNGKKSAEPFGYQAISESVEDLQRCATIFARANFPTSPMASTEGRALSGGKIRIGYVSGEFRDHATAILMVGLLEQHDKQRFDIVAFDNGWDDDSAIRQRIRESVAEIVDISRMGDVEAAEAVRERRIDILVNLNGYFGESRQGIFSRRPAPIQVNYLGFPGTIGADYIDYIVADRCVIPPEHRDFYTEKVVWLPDTYQANDARRKPVRQMLSRTKLGLPESGFVFCCFNNNYKITPAIFNIWMRLLSKVEGSVLWLLEDSPAAAANLRREAEKRGIVPDRLVFAPRMKHDDHIARQQAADLFIDTLPYNAHTTASDALWAGLPVLTCVGNTFPGRVGASLLQAVGMHELIASSLEQYETIAVDLARNPDGLQALRQTLQKNLPMMPLFDTGLFARHIEAALQSMCERHCAGLVPEHIALPQ